MVKPLTQGRALVISLARRPVRRHQLFDLAKQLEKEQKVDLTSNDVGNFKKYLLSMAGDGLLEMKADDKFKASKDGLSKLDEFLALADAIA